MVETLKFENINGTIQVIIRDEGKIVARRRLKGSGIKTKQEFRDIYSANKTLHKDRAITRFGGKTFKTTFIPGNINGPIAEKKGPQFQSYFVEGDVHYKGKIIHIGVTSNQDMESNAEARADAWEYFIGKMNKVLSGQTGSGGDDDMSGLSQVTNVREGWLTYA